MVLEKGFRVSALSVLLGAVIAISTTVLSLPAGAVLIDFNTDGNGNPYTGLVDSFGANEYSALGVTINDSDPQAGSTFVNLTNPLNVGTSISGYYVNVGSFIGLPTFLDLSFSGPATNVSFDFATVSGALAVAAFDGLGTLLGNLTFQGTSGFRSGSGAPFLAGNASITGLGPVSRLVATAPLTPGGLRQTAIFDNLSFQSTAVPEPSSLILFGIGLAGLGLIWRHRQRRALLGLPSPRSA